MGRYEAALGAIATRATNGITIPVNRFAANAPTVVASADVARILLDSTILVDALRGRPAADAYALCAAKMTNRGLCGLDRGVLARIAPGEEAIPRRLVAAHGVRRWVHPKEFSLDRGAASSPDEGSPSPADS